MQRQIDRNGNDNENKKGNLIYIAVIILIYLALFLFIKDKILFTPDFGESDSYHYNLSLKYHLAQTLNTDNLPFWTDKLAGGYPLFSEGQTGALFIPNLFFLKLFPFTYGYNGLFIFSLFCLTAGFYLLLKEYDVSSILALVFSIIFTFSGSIGLRLVHLSFIQPLSLAPFLFLVGKKYLKTKNKRYLLIFSILLSQMILAGHPQAVFISLLGLFLWLVVELSLQSLNLREKITTLVMIISATIAGILFSFAQLLPSFILKQSSGLLLTLNFKDATSYPLSIANLISYVSPYFYGSPKLGTYPIDLDRWGIFWENTPYLGSLLFVVLIFLVVLKFRSILREKHILYFLILTFLFLLLALGKNGPLYLIFNLSPFNLFRVPSRFLIMANFFIIMAAAFLGNNFYKSPTKAFFKVIFVLLLLINAVQLIFFTFDYHLFSDSKTLLEKPKITQYIDDSYYITLGQADAWNGVFVNQGWQGKGEIDKYIYFKNFLYPNSNLLFDKKSYMQYSSGANLYRPGLLNALIQNGIRINEKEATIKSQALSLMQILGIKNIITSYPINDKSLRLTGKINEDSPKIYSYALSDISSSFYYIPATVRKINSLYEFSYLYRQNKLSKEYGVIEQSPFDKFINTKDYKIINQQQDDYSKTIAGEFNKDTLVVFKVNYYPEWQGFVDNTKVKTYKVNVSHTGILVPAGKHSVRLIFQNYYFKIGLIISLVSFVVYFIITVL